MDGDVRVGFRDSCAVDWDVRVGFRDSCAVDWDVRVGFRVYRFRVLGLGFRFRV